MMANKRALVVEDNADLARLIQLHLQDIQLEADIATDGLAALDLYRQGKYDVVLLDIMLPDLDGFEVCRRIRSGDAVTPILMLTARAEEIDKVVGLELGADDYLSKPFGVAEFTARVRALMRRAATTAQSEDAQCAYVCHGDISIDCDKHTAQLNNQQVDLTAREFQLLLHFVKYPGQVFNRNELLEKVWGYSNGVYQHTVNSHINRLRTKIELDPANPEYIVTVWGVGYKLNEQVETGSV